MPFPEMLPRAPRPACSAEGRTFEKEGVGLPGPVRLGRLEWKAAADVV